MAGRQEPGSAKAVVYDPPYAVGTPVRGREDGAAGSVFAPFGFLHETLLASARALMPGGIAVIFCDWRRMHDLGQMASDVRPAARDMRRVGAHQAGHRRAAAGIVGPGAGGCAGSPGRR